MSWPRLKTYDRVDRTNEAAERDDGFEKSYVGMRLVIGGLGVLLPLLLVIVDAALLTDPLSVRGSMSAYYHSPARDLFVGGLSACGITLVTYMFWKWWTWDFLLSLLGGLGVLGVATFPTGRPRPDGFSGDLSCDDASPDIPPCTALQQALGEAEVRMAHLAATAVVVACFALLCLVFALREFGYGLAAHQLVGNDPGQLGPVKIWERLALQDFATVGRHVRHEAPRTVLYLLCLAGILLGAGWAKIGGDWPVPHSYAGEFIAFSSFGSAWIVASWDLLRRSKLVNATVVTVSTTVSKVGEALKVSK